MKHTSVIHYYCYLPDKMNILLIRHIVHICIHHLYPPCRSLGAPPKVVLLHEECVLCTHWSEMTLILRKNDLGQADKWVFLSKPPLSDTSNWLNCGSK